MTAPGPAASPISNAMAGPSDARGRCTSAQPRVAYGGIIYYGLMSYLDFGGVVTNIIGLVTELGKNGLVGDFLQRLPPGVFLGVALIVMIYGLMRSRLPR